MAGAAGATSDWTHHGSSASRVAAGGVDIGGTKIAAALVDATGATVTYETMPSNVGAGAAAVLDSADRLIDGLARTASDRGLSLCAIGVGVPELVDTNGRVASSAVIPSLGDDDLVRRWKRTGSLVIESDVRAAALAEAQLGAGRGCSSFAYISVGTGISYCLVIDGLPWTGSRGGAILLGSSVMAEFDSGPWVLEEIASGTALLNRYRAAGGQLRDVADVLSACATDSTAATAVQEGAHALGIGIASVVNLLDPAVVVVGGGLGSADGPYWDGALQSARAHVYWACARDVPIVHAQLGASAGAIGAALVGLRHACQGREPRH